MNLAALHYFIFKIVVMDKIHRIFEPLEILEASTINPPAQYVR